MLKDKSKRPPYVKCRRGKGNPNKNLESILAAPITVSVGNAIAAEEKTKETHKQSSIIEKKVGRVVEHFFVKYYGDKFGEISLGG